MATLDLPGDTKVEDAKPQDIAHALAQPRDEDWYLIVSRGESEDDYIEVSTPDGKALELVCEVGEEYLEAQSHLDPQAVEAILADFAAGGDAWRQMARWAKPPPAAARPPLPGTPPKPFIVAGIVWAVLFVGAMLFGRGALVAAVFGLAFPGIIAMAVLVKQREVKRAESWSKASARIIRSELVERTINGKEVKVPAVEYEFAIGMDFNKIRGNRISFAEVEGPHGAEERLAKYRVGSSATVYYNPADPRESVLERDFPAALANATWAFVAVLTALILGAGYWWGLR